ncbi:hypothetical protein GOBAR_AA07683 [Gossypium barbadense]|uniref:Uncharacterized protein n=1 Tax=Gossypium barbadense TaxID=3634 RepID=A0A2P5YBK2_GOSBA|nr:hypothetical protein GOBAR_AA07683 [Gossypium barbadense]
MVGGCTSRKNAYGFFHLKYYAGANVPSNVTVRRLQHRLREAASRAEARISGILSLGRPCGTKSCV